MRITRTWYSIPCGAEGTRWPGGKPMPRWLVGSMSNSIDATALMWAFYRDHPLVSTLAIPLSGT